MCIPGRGQWWGHVHTLSHDQSSGESLCEWTCGPVSPGPDRHREGERGTEDDEIELEYCVSTCRMKRQLNRGGST